MKKMDMLHGSIADKTWTFALLLAATGICQQLFNAVDILIMGRFAGKTAMAAVGSNAPVVGIVVTFFIGISLGANVVISQLTGRKDRKGVKRAVHTAIIAAFSGGILMALLGELLAAPLMHILSVPKEVQPLSLTYLRIMFLALPGILLYNFTSAIFRSQGDTRTPFLCLIISGVVKVAASLFLVLVLDMGVSGVAVSTLCATLLSSLMLLALLSHTSLAVHISLKEAVLDLSMLKEILSVGVPAGLQGAVFSLSNIVIQSAINSLGEEVMAASAAAFNLEIIAYYVINAFGQACTTFTGQNYGAGLISRCRKIFLITFGQSLGAMILVCGLILLFGTSLLSLFSTDRDVIDYGYIRLEYILGAEVLNLIIEMISGFLRGFGKSLIPAITVTAGICISRVIYVATIFRWSPDFDTLMAVYPLSWLLTDLGMAAVLLYYRKIYMAEDGK
ncbi:MATE family efflux transporter [uncultured Dialister sp.]|uniref:MATE family efflux transporter n=1 Tax=uncultured Dialister sp. TaxID=278064 RepID=UPI002608F43F|nr:MATE family efflux transporter [uncultured Dialister sp.]